MKKNILAVRHDSSSKQRCENSWEQLSEMTVDRNVHLGRGFTWRRNRVAQLMLGDSDERMSRANGVDSHRFGQILQLAEPGGYTRSVNGTPVNWTVGMAFGPN
jgi:hypothetical protein